MRLKAGDKVVIVQVDSITSEQTFAEEMMDDIRVDDAQVATFNGFGTFVMDAEE